jgi:hypothetical protein
VHHNGKGKEVNNKNNVKTRNNTPNQIHKTNTIILTIQSGQDRRNCYERNNEFEQISKQRLTKLGVPSLAQTMSGISASVLLHRSFDNVRFVLDHLLDTQCE